MNAWLILAPFMAVGIGTAAAYTATHRDWNKRIHFVKRGNLQSELSNLEIDIEEAETCVECGDEIQPEDIGAVIRVDSGYRIVCDKRMCLDIHDINQESLDTYISKPSKKIS